MIKNEWMKHVIKYKGINDRIALLEIKNEFGQMIKIIQVYAPTSTSQKKDYEYSLEVLKETMNLATLKNTIITEREGRI